MMHEGTPDDEGVLDPSVARWLEEHPQIDLTQGFPPELLDAARNYQGPPPTRLISHVNDDVVGQVPIRIYRNDGALTAVVVYFHGGAFTVGSINIMDEVARAITDATGAVVISVDYRLAPEHPYPAGFEDCLTVTSWALAASDDKYGIPASGVILAGESAGGNLATAVALRLRDDGAANVAGQVLIYPSTDGRNASYPSRDQFGRHDWVWESYGGGRDLSHEPYAVPMSAPSLRGLPPALVLLAGCDALRDEGRAYARRMQAEGVEVEEFCYAGQPHGFVNFGLPAANDVYKRTGEWVRAHARID